MISSLCSPALRTAGRCFCAPPPKPSRVCAHSSNRSTGRATSSGAPPTLAGSRASVASCPPRSLSACLPCLIAASACLLPALTVAAPSVCWERCLPSPVTARPPPSSPCLPACRPLLRGLWAPAQRRHAGTTCVLVAKGRLPRLLLLLGMPPQASASLSWARGVRQRCRRRLLSTCPSSNFQRSTPRHAQVMFEGLPSFPHDGRWWEIVDKHQASAS